METRRAVLAASIIGCALALLVAGAAHAEEYDFLRLVETSKLGLGNVSGSYSLEVKRGIADYEKQGGGGGGGGGLGGKKDYQGVNHRLTLFVGVSKWVSLGLEQTVKHQELGDMQMGVIAPEADLNLSHLDAIPFDLTFFAGPRIRAAARRGSTMSLGMGVGKVLGRWNLATRLAFETSVEKQAQKENGMRYELGVACTIVRWVTVSLEGWGALVWPQQAVFQQDHHLGPSVIFRIGQVWLAVNGNVGMKERPNRYFVDYGVMFQLGAGM